MQRFFDLVLSGLAILALSPLLLPLFILLRLTGEGEVFYRQVRVGRHGEDFHVLKFATMLKDSPNIGTGSITLRKDPRVLPVGRWLRKTKLNELPQLFNVLSGDMSLIGPRPLTRDSFEAFPAEIRDVIAEIRPGLSGIGSVIFRDEEELLSNCVDAREFHRIVITPYKGRVEEWYARRRSLLMYFLLILLTAWVVAVPDSKVVWRIFPSLPIPPADLAALRGHLPTTGEP
jgi:lipopolysaccharide/colanic/teichoic acid biosynthesis glycosyltransferase